MTQRTNPHSTANTAPKRAAFVRTVVSRLIAAQAVILVVVVLITTPSGAG